MRPGRLDSEASLRAGSHMRYTTVQVEKITLTILKAQAASLGTSVQFSTMWQRFWHDRDELIQSLFG